MKVWIFYAITMTVLVGLLCYLVSIIYRNYKFHTKFKSYNFKRVVGLCVIYGLGVISIMVIFTLAMIGGKHYEQV